MRELYSPYVPWSGPVNVLEPVLVGTVDSLDKKIISTQFTIVLSPKYSPI